MELIELEQEFRDYEISFLGLADSVIQEMGDLLARLKMEIIFTDTAKSINLAYLIEKHRTAFFGCLQFRTLPEKIESLKNELSLNQNIFRFLIITPPIKKAIEKTKPSPEKLANETPPQKRENVSEEKTIKTAPEILSNELLEQKLEEILQ